MNEVCISRYAKIHRLRSFRHTDRVTHVPPNKPGAAPVAIRTLNSPTIEQQRRQQHLHPKEERRNWGTAPCDRPAIHDTKAGIAETTKHIAELYASLKTPLPTSATASRVAAGARGLAEKDAAAGN